MVRLIPVERAGKTVYAEDAPNVCPAGHEGVQIPGWGQCPTCLYGLRDWRCPTCGVKQYDDDHQHRE